MKDNRGEAQEVEKAPEEGRGQVIRTTVKTDPGLNPGAPEFDPVAYQAALDARGGLDAAVKDAAKRINAGFDVLTKAFRDMPTGEAVTAALAGTSQSLEELKESMQDHLEAVPAGMQGLQEIMADLKAMLTDGEARYREWLEGMRAKGGREHLLLLADNMPFVTAGLTGFIGLAGQMGDYLEEELSKPEYEGHTMQALIIPLEEDPNATLWEKAVANAEEAMKTAEPDRYRAMMEARGRQGQESKESPERYSTLKLAERAFFPLLNGPATNDFMSLSTSRNWRWDGHNVIYSVARSKFIVKNFDSLLSRLNTSTKKILDVSIAHLTYINYYKTDSVNPVVIIDLLDYWRAQGFHVDPYKMPTPKEQEKENKAVEENIKSLKEKLNGDLEALKENLVWKGEETGKNKGLKYNFSFISSYYPMGGRYMKINFDIDMATYLVRNCGIMQWPTSLLLHDNRDPNGYAIGRKIAFHSSLDSNVAAGTDKTLSVKSLLDIAPDIPTIEELREAGRRDWKAKIKGKLEKSLDKNKALGFIERWEYRDPRKGAVLTPKEADSLPWDTYIALMIDYAVTEAPGQEERRAKRALEKSQEKKPGKKRTGRPKKAPSAP